MRISSLPSLLTSATATPSERNTGSTTIFFHLIGPSALGGSSAGKKLNSAGNANSASQHRERRMGMILEENFGESRWGDYLPGCKKENPRLGFRTMPTRRGRLSSTVTPSSKRPAMRAIISVLVALAVVDLFGPFAQADEKKIDAAKLIGKWETTKINGEEIKPSEKG